MEKYEKYKDSGIEWIGEIPGHWEVKPVKYISKNYDGKRIPLNASERAEKKGDFPYYGATGIVDYVNDYLFDGEFVLIGEDGAPFFIEGRDVSFIASGKFWVNNHAHILKPEDTISSILLAHYLNCVDYRNYITGSTRDKLTQDQLNCIKLPLPTTPEQTAIANYLDSKTAEIDELIADKKRLLELYEEEKTAIINQAVTKGINPDVPMKDSGIEWLGEIPEHWEVKRLKTIARVQTGRTPKIQNSQVDFFENGELNWFTPSDFEGNSELIDSNRKLISDAIETGEVELFPEYSIYLVSIGATLGKVSFFRNKASANQQINIIIFHPTFNPLFGYYFLVGNKDMITLEADYTTLPILNQSKTKGLFFAVPPPEEQQSIVNYIEAECARVQAKKAKTEKLIELLIEYRTALISEVVTGKIKVTE